MWYDFIKLYYKLLPLFTHFIQDPVHRAGLLELLQGEVYDRSDVPPVLESMRSYIRDVEANESHVLHPNLSSIPIDEAGSATLRLDQGAIEEQGRRRTG